MRKRHTWVRGSPKWNEIADRQRVPDGRIMCPLCDRVWPIEFEDNLVIDRIVPGNDGPGYTLENCQLTCPACNAIKNQRPQAEARELCLAARQTTAYERLAERNRENQQRMLRDAPERMRATNRRAARRYNARNPGRSRQWELRKSVGPKPTDNPPLRAVN